MSNESRGIDIRRRRIAHGIKSLTKFAEKTGVSRDAITAAEAGAASTATYERLEAWLDRYDVETGSDDAEEGSGPVTIRMSGDFGVEITVQGPAGSLPELRDAASALLRQAQEGSHDARPT